MKFFVFYNDDYADNGGIGFEEFATQKEVTDFIAGRIATAPNPKHATYRVIQGHEMKVVPKQFATRFELEAFPH